ncbi:hypothetical protein PP2015_3226 [Pseudoalteromonas phenolica]|uniref:Uncharacterized protein n=1 Tax=Pseudoalteromonas phenolica TaxID=161398 RepID=A0A0S2K6A2_9GAMM|nr:hypothetical protein PP2015_3226 [Pseudoalteromonas phenolica]
MSNVASKMVWPPTSNNKGRVTECYWPMLLTCVHHEFWVEKQDSVACLVEIDYQLDLWVCQSIFENNSHLDF